jgi:AcrR family transcriptional regulator
MPVVAPSTKELIVLAGERLFAQHGIDGVSMREIGAAAGNGNKSAVQYHFGSKDQLIQAIFEYRLPRLHERRTLLIREREPDSLRVWVECQVRAVLQQSELDGSHYMSFVAMLDEHGRRDLFSRMAPEFRRAANEMHEHLAAFLPHVPVPLRSRRIAAAMALIVHVAARRERARAGGRPVLPFAVEVAELVDGMVGFLEASVSPDARRAAGDADPAAVAWSSLL